MNKFSTGELRYIEVLFNAHHQILAGQPYGDQRSVLIHDKTVDSCPCSCAKLWQKVDAELTRREKEPVA